MKTPFKYIPALFMLLPFIYCAGRVNGLYTPLKTAPVKSYLIKRDHWTKDEQRQALRYLFADDGK